MQESPNHFWYWGPGTDALGVPEENASTQSFGFRDGGRV